MLYRFAYGNHLGTLTYAWKIPDDKPVDNAAVSRIYNQLSKEQSTYSTRAMRVFGLLQYLSKCFSYGVTKHV